MKTNKTFLAIILFSTLFSCLPKKEDVPQPITKQAIDITNCEWRYDSTVIYYEDNSVMQSGIDEHGNYTIAYNNDATIKCTLPSGLPYDYFVDWKWSINTDTLILTKDCFSTSKSIIKILTDKQMVLVTVNVKQRKTDTNKYTYYFSKVKP